jgi:hypothetical protein
VPGFGSARARASLRRCASPPESVESGWPSAGSRGRASRAGPSARTMAARRRRPPGPRRRSSRARRRPSGRRASPRAPRPGSAPAQTRAGERHVGEELHLDGLEALARARLAAPAGHVEREGARPSPRASASAGSRRSARTRSHAPGVGRGVAARGAPERRLIDERRRSDLRRALQPSWAPGASTSRSPRARDGAIEDVVDERALARAARAGDGDRPRRGGSSTSRRAGCWRGLPRSGCGRSGGARRAASLARRARARPRGRVGAASSSWMRAVVRRATRRRLSGAGAELDDCDRRRGGPGVVLDDEHHVAAVGELAHRADERRDVRGGGRRWARRGRRARRERGAERRGERDALRLAAGERAGLTIEREVAEADALEVREALESSARAMLTLPVSRAKRLEAGAASRSSRRARRRDRGRPRGTHQRRRGEALAVARVADVVRAR